MTFYDDDAGDAGVDATDADAASPPAARGSGGERPDTEALLRRAQEVVGNARPMPLSSSVMVNRDEVLELVEEALDRMPDELRQARWLLKEREEFLAKVRREADDILDEARNRAEKMVQRTEIVRAAQVTARRIVEDANDEARRLRHEAEDYCDQKLAAFEIVLERTAKTVAAGRERLRAVPASPVSLEPGSEEALADEAADAFFDQELD